MTEDPKHAENLSIVEAYPTKPEPEPTYVVIPDPTHAAKPTYWTRLLAYLGKK